MHVWVRNDFYAWNLSNCSNFKNGAKITNDFLCIGPTYEMMLFIIYLVVE